MSARAEPAQGSNTMVKLLAGADGAKQVSDGAKDSDSANDSWETCAPWAQAS